MRFWPLTTNERAENNMTHALELTADDLTMATANTLQTITTPLLFSVGDTVRLVNEKLKVAFKASGDAAFNSTTMSVGDSVGGVATLLAATQLNENGTEILDVTAVPTGMPATGFTAPTVMTVTFNAMAAKSLLSLNTGVVIIQVEVGRSSAIPNAISTGPILTK